MLASDLVMLVRASRTISGEEVERLERTLFGAGMPSDEQIDLLFLMDSYLDRPHPRWSELLARAALAALVPPRRAAPIARAA
jgi:hypothetical protein